MEREEFSKNIPLFLSLVLVSAVLILSDFFGVLRPVRGLVEREVNPVMARVFKIREGLISELKVFTFWRSGTVKIAHLEERVRELSVLEGELVSLREENEEMRRLLGASLPKAWNFLPVKIVGKDEDLFISKGREEGIKTGMMVVSEKILVGRVKETGESLSRVLMPNSRESKIPVKVIRNGQLVGKGVIVGLPEGRMILDKVLQKEEIKNKDLLMTSGEGGYLADLLVGEISEIQKKEAEVFQKAEVEPLLNYEELGTVFVVTESE